MEGQHQNHPDSIGGFHIVRELGRGGMGVVYEARHEELKRTVAIKVISAQYFGDADYLKRFEREARLSASIEHPNVVRIFDFNRDGDTYFLVMELVEGLPLSSILEQKEKLDLPTSFRIAKEIAIAMQATHGKAVLHRDIKPHNVMVDPTGNVKVMDFGLAKPMDVETQASQTKGTLGTPAYMSPEQVRKQNVSTQSDIYSLGVVLFEMLTGRLPYEADNPLALMFQIAEEPFPMPTSVLPSLPKSIDMLVGKMVAKNSADRYASASELLVDLEQFLADPSYQVDSQKSFDQLVAPTPDETDSSEGKFGLDNELIEDLVAAKKSAFKPREMDKGPLVPPGAWKFIFGVPIVLGLLMVPLFLPEPPARAPVPEEIPEEAAFQLTADDVRETVGTRKTFQRADGQRVQFETSDEIIFKGETFRTTRLPFFFNADRSNHYFLHSTDRQNIVAYYYALTDEYPSIEIPILLRPGDSWEVDIYLGNPDMTNRGPFTYYYRADEETIDVPAGIFQTIRVVGSPRNPPEPTDPEARIYWFAPGFGVIKWHDVNWKGQFTISLERVTSLN